VRNERRDRQRSKVRDGRRNGQLHSCRLVQILLYAVIRCLLSAGSLLSQQTLDPLRSPSATLLSRASALLQPPVTEQLLDCPTHLVEQSVTPGSSSSSSSSEAAYQLPRLEHTVHPFRAGESLASGTAVGEEWLRGSRGCSRASYPSRELSNGRVKPSRARSGKETDARSKFALDPRLGEELRERSGSCRSVMISELARCS